MSGIRFSLRPLLVGWAVSFAVFGIFALLLGSQFHSDGQPVAELIRVSVKDWLPWAITAPLVFLSATRFPLARGYNRKRVPAYVAGALLCLAFAAVWASFWERDPHPHGFRDHDDFAEIFRGPDRRHGGPPKLMFAAWGLPIYLATVGLAQATHQSRRARERELRAMAMEAGLARARLDALRMQLQPHFLFNSLNAVAELTHRDPDRADAMIVALATFLRTTLEAPADPELPLARELGFTELYLRIERVRFAERLDVVRDIDPAALAAHVPPFILQPLVENAVRHGLSRRSPVTRVSLHARREGDALLLRVSDNGPGSGGPVREGVGLSNVRSRLEATYPGAAQLTFRDDDGFVVEIRIPFRA